MFSFLFSLNPAIITAIIGALIGSIAAWTLSYFTEEKKFNRKKKGAYALLKSEIGVFEPKVFTVCNLSYIAFAELILPP